MEEVEIIVTREEFEFEQRLVAELERRLVELQARWVEVTRGLIVVTPEEYSRELAEVEALERLLSEAYSAWGRYMAYRRWAVARREEALAARYLERIRRIMAEIVALRREISARWAEIARKTIITPEIEALRAEIEKVTESLEYERWRLQRKVVCLYIGTEAKTGYDIFYSPERKTYPVAHPVTREKVREEHKIVVEYTASIETGVPGKTGAFERLVVEITAITGVKEATMEDLKRIDGEIEGGVLDYLANPWVEGGNWGAALAGFRKKGTQYNGLSIVEEQDHYGYSVPQYPRVAIHVEKVAWFKVEKTPPDRPELKPGDMVKVTKAEDLSWALRMVRLGYLKETDLTGARVHDYGWHEFSLR
jgi:hypothetical protein